MFPTIQHIIQHFSHLPASQIACQVNALLKSNSALVITAPPGAGKSTLLPLTILAGQTFDGIPDGKSLMLEPRRLAARQVAERMAKMLGEPVGQTVGYRVRFESKVSEKTRIEVITEGILTRIIVDDATLEGVSMVVFDEFHERSVNTDLALALARHTQNIIRPDLKIVIMSATLDSEYVCTTLHAPLVKGMGRIFPVHIENAESDTDIKQIARASASAVIEAHGKHDGDILVFLPGQGEIEQCCKMLGSSLAPTAILPLYGNLSSEQQRRAIAPSHNDERKVVLATPIAETSITIEGVRVVVDSGLCRKLVFDARTGLSHLQTVRISMDMATQRAGRAGRLGNGICYRLWTKGTERHMDMQRSPEIEDADLAPVVLGIAAFGENDINTLPWITVPPRGNVEKARKVLLSLGAIDDNGNITVGGKRMAALPCHPRIARMILSASTESLRSLACDIAALLEEKDPMDDTAGTSLALRVYMLRSARRRRQLGGWQRIAQTAAEYRRMTHATEQNEDPAPEHIGMLVAHAYPERIATSIDKVGGYRLASGDNVRIDASDPQTAHTWLAVASAYSPPGSTGRVFLAAPLSVDDIVCDIAKERDNVSWDSRQGCVVMRRERRIGKLMVDSRPIHDVSKEKVKEIICEAVRKDGHSMLSWNGNDVIQLQRRVATVSAWHPEMDIPDISTEHLINTASVWLPLYLDDGDKVRSNITELRKLNLADILWNIIPYDIQATIDSIAPTHIKVPTGSRIRIDYRQGAEAPVLSVRLQECFGMERTPTVDGGRRPVLMELLSPGFKPVQLTQDLESFWKNTYFEVRKDFRRRYPKHYWPENPLEAEAVRGVKRK